MIFNQLADDIESCDALLVLWCSPEDKIDVSKIAECRKPVLLYAPIGVEIPGAALDAARDQCHVMEPSAFPEPNQLGKLLEVMKQTQMM